ncbi:MAG: hypothetical protein JSS89_05515 [Bacteroidetes bacterium]|nr:hypothetical protein [Bacteroidota bacterium]
MKWLKETGQYDDVMERKRQKEEERQKYLEEIRLAEAPLVRELQATGYAVASAWDFVNMPNVYVDALPILMTHLTHPYPLVVREGIARAMAMPQAHPYLNQLIALYRNAKEERVQHALAVAVSAIARDTDLEDVIVLLRDVTLGASRVFLMKVLERSKNDSAQAVLDELGSDPDLVRQYQEIVKRRDRRVKRRRQE